MGCVRAKSVTISGYPQLSTTKRKLTVTLKLLLCIRSHWLGSVTVKKEVTVTVIESNMEVL